MSNKGENRKIIIVSTHQGLPPRAMRAWLEIITTSINAPKQHAEPKMLAILKSRFSECAECEAPYGHFNKKSQLNTELNRGQRGGKKQKLPRPQ